jgi:hypothetical protein
MLGLIYGIAVLLIILWLAGFALNVAGGLIHILLILAVIAIVYNLFIYPRDRV